MSCLVETLEHTKQRDVLKCWVLVVRLLGRHLHSGADLINKVMKVVEKGFKFLDTLEESFRSWMILMNNFALDTRTLTHAKRIKLLMTPLLNKNVTTESEVRVKLECWWHFIVVLGHHITNNMDTVVMPFIRFCYGQSEKSRAAQLAKNPKSPGTPLSPAKNHSALEKLCLDALIQLLCPRPLHATLPRTSLSETLSELLITPNMLVDHMDDILFSVREATRLLRPANKSDVLRVEHIWSGVARLLSQASDDQAYQKYFSAVKNTVVQLRRMEKLCHLLVHILHDAVHLPLTVLTNSSILNTAERPGSMLLDLLLYADFVEGSHKSLDAATNNLFCAVFNKLVEVHLYPWNSVDSVGQVLERLEKCVTISSLSQSGLEMIDTMWQSVATSASKLNNPTNQSEGPSISTNQSSSFRTVLSILKFPAQYLYVRGGSEKSLVVWEKLFKIVLEHGETSIHHESGYIVSEMADRLETLLKTRQSSSQLLINSRMIKMRVETLDWATVSRNIKNSSVSGVKNNPLAGIQMMMNPLGNITSLIKHLKHLTEKLITKPREHLDVSVSQQLLKSYLKLFSINNQDLIRPVLKSGTSSAFSQFLGEEFLLNIMALDASVLVDIEKVFSALITMIKVKYNKEYTEEFLAEIEPFVVMSLSSPRHHFRDQAREMWTVTFSNLSQDKISAQLNNVINAPAAEGVETTFTGSSDGSLTQQMIAEPAIIHGLKKTSSFERTPGSPASSAKTNTPAAGSKRTRKSLCLQLEDEDSAMFVPIKTTPKGKRVLTEHQRDVLTSRHDDIPALYSELSRDDSLVMLPSQFSSQDSHDAESRQSEESDESVSLLRNMKSRKNQRFEIPDTSRSTRSNKSLNDTKDMFSEGSSDDFKKPDNPDKAENNSIISESETGLNDSTGSSVNNSVSSQEDVIESSQDMTMDAGVTPRRSRRKSLIEKQEKGKNVATSSTSGAVDSKRNKWGETNLFVAVKMGQKTKVKDLLEQGASTELYSSTGYYPLHEAAISAKDEAVEIIKLLVDKG